MRQIAFTISCLLLLCLPGYGQEKGPSPLELERLISKLRHKDRAVRIDAIGRLGRLGRSNPVVILPLINMLIARDWPVSKAAADALVGIGKPAVSGLIKELQGSRSQIQRRVIGVLGRIGARSAAAVPALIGWLEYLPNPASRALGRIGKPAVPALIRALSDKNRTRRYFTASALAQIGPEAAAAVGALIKALADRSIQGEVLVALENIGPGAAPALPWLIELLPNRRAARVLTAIGRPAVSGLVGALAHRESRVRARAAWALGRMNAVASPAIPTLISSSRMGDGRPRIQAICALGRIGKQATAALDTLGEMLLHEQWNVRLYAAEALGRIASPAAVTDLVRAVRVELDPGVARYLARALRKLGKSQAEVAALLADGERAREARVKALIAKLSHRTPGVRAAARASLTQMGLNVLPQLRAAPRAQADAVRRVERAIRLKIRTLAKYGDPYSTSDWALLLCPSSAKSVKQIAWLIRTEQDRGHREALLGVLEWLVRLWPMVDKTPPIILQLARQARGKRRIRALGIAAWIGDPPAIRLLRQVIETETKTEAGGEWRHVAIRLAGRTNAAVLGRSLMTLFDRDDIDQTVLLKALGNVGIGVDAKRIRRIHGRRGEAGRALRKIEILSSPQRDEMLMQEFRQSSMSGTFSWYGWALSKIRRLRLRPLGEPLRAQFTLKADIWVRGRSSSRTRAIDTIHRFGGSITAEEYEILRNAGRIP